MQLSKPKVSMEVSCPSADWPPSKRRPGGGAGSNDVPAQYLLSLSMSFFLIWKVFVWFYLFKENWLPRVGGAEKLKLQDAIPPFSLMEDSTHGKRAETLVKTAKSCWLQLSPSLLLTIPTRIWAPSSVVVVSGPPLSPWFKIIENYGSL